MRTFKAINQSIIRLDRIKNPVDRSIEAKKLRSEKRQYYSKATGDREVIRRLTTAVEWVLAGDDCPVSEIDIADKAVAESGVTVNSISSARGFVRLLINTTGF